eukprot:TRINITY_DN3214_c0_g1_i1.p1 TRINITY_DN3214_c0_g1~~TRINITY_DN3214_c0_g1_i1.p1  ORF type:complete len:317 (-),score=61.00 TRINITY_DN3214_c0_g1_i1:128-1078(-)
MSHFLQAGQNVVESNFSRVRVLDDAEQQKYENEKIKQEQYCAELAIQIEEKKRRKQAEKKKELQDDIRMEQKFQLSLSPSKAKEKEDRVPSVMGYGNKNRRGSVVLDGYDLDQRSPTKHIQFDFSKASQQQHRFKLDSPRPHEGMLGMVMDENRSLKRDIYRMQNELEKVQQQMRSIQAEKKAFRAVFPTAIQSPSRKHAPTSPVQYESPPPRSKSTPNDSIMEDFGRTLGGDSVMVPVSQLSDPNFSPNKGMNLESQSTYVPIPSPVLTSGRASFSRRSSSNISARSRGSARRPAPQLDQQDQLENFLMEFINTT